MSRIHFAKRDEKSTDPEGWIRVNKIGPILEIATCCLHGKYVVGMNNVSLKKDNSHSWVRLSHGVKKLFTNLNNSKQETSEVQFEEDALKLEVRDFACRSKAKAKPQRRERADSSTNNHSNWVKNLDRC